MKDEKDLAQIIAEAVQKESEPKMTNVDFFDPKKDTVIGEVPLHLRHLYNLLIEFKYELFDTYNKFIVADRRHRVVSEVFLDALEHHLPTISDGEYDAIKVCNNWTIVGLKHDNRDSTSVDTAFADMMNDKGKMN